MTQKTAVRLLSNTGSLERRKAMGSLPQLASEGERKVRWDVLHLTPYTALHSPEITNQGHGLTLSCRVQLLAIPELGIPKPHTTPCPRGKVHCPDLPSPTLMLSCTNNSIHSLKPTESKALHYAHISFPCWSWDGKKEK